MEISLNDALLLQNKGNKILFDPPPPPTHTHAQKGSRIQTVASVCLYQQSMT